MSNDIQTTTRMNPLVEFRTQIEDRGRELKMALPAGISVEKFQRTVTTAVQQSPDLLKANRQSLILACMKAAQDGLLPDGREAALVIFSSRKKNPQTNQFESVKLVQYMPMVYGLRKKILQARDGDAKPIVSALSVGVVYRAEAENGYFVWDTGNIPEVQHRPMLELSAEQAKDSEIVAAYSIVHMADGTISSEVMRRFEVDKVRQMSQTGALGQVVKWGDMKGKPIDPKGPWVDWFAEMAKKTVMRRHSKTLPMSGDTILDLGSSESEIEAGMSAAGVLDREDEDPALLIDSSGEQFNAETGESVEAGAGKDADPPVEARKRGRPPKEKDEDPAKADLAPPAKAETKNKPADPDQPVHEAAEAKPEATVAEDDGGPSPSYAKAEELLGRFESAENIIDLDSIYKGSVADRAAMSDDIHAPIEASYKRHCKRLGRVVPETTE